MDPFDQIPDCILLDIFNSISDAKTLIRCLSVSKRFNSLIPLTTTLLLRVDQVIPIYTTSTYSSFLLFSFLKTLLVNLFFLPSQPSSLFASPTRILRVFPSIRHLDIELPSGDLTVDNDGDSHTVIKYKAFFGETLKTCVILGFRNKVGGESEKEMDEEVKERVVWVIKALMGASRRHACVAREVVREHRDLVRLRVRDREGEGEVEMDGGGLGECREKEGLYSGEGRSRVPMVRMRMRYERKLEVGDGVSVEGATLVVVRASKGESEAEEVEDENELVMEAFGKGAYKEAVRALMNNRSYLLEMNSF